MLISALRKRINNRSRFTALLTIAVIATISISSFVLTSSAHAFTPNYNWNDLIDNPTFIDTSTMSAGDIQTFLSNIGSGLAGYSDVEACDSTIAPYYTHCGQTISAAQIISDASQAYSVNPRVILATLEKEQSLVTDPTPTASQIDCAMGYNSCSGYSGFFTQVDNGTWALKYNYEGAFQTATWLAWSPGANYPCSSPKANFYSPGIYPGNNVTFVDAGGTSEEVNIANAATASLYCYTPYVGPYSVTGYSGSYNFVYYYQLWFGSTQTSMAYSWSWENQGAYEDSGYSQEFNRGGVHAVVAPGGTAYLQVQAINVGYDTWTQSIVHLGTSNPDDRCSVFANNSWLSCARIQMLQSSVIPGGTGTFDFSITAPSTPGDYQEYFNLVADGITWMNGPELYFNIAVTQPLASPPVAPTAGAVLEPGQSLTPGQYVMSPDTQSVLGLQQNGNLGLYIGGQQMWSTNTTGYEIQQLVMQGDGNLVLYGNGIADWNSGTVGNPGAYLVLQNDGNLVIYSSGGTALWNSSTAGVPNSGLNYVTQVLANGGILYPGQELSTANRQDQLIFQPDGNLVLYTNGTAVWSSSTYHENSAELIMQGDGNLVIYNANGTAIWWSGTAGQGSSQLVIQSDDNLVMYSNETGGALWNTNTYMK